LLLFLFFFFFLTILVGSLRPAYCRRRRAHARRGRIPPRRRPRRRPLLLLLLLLLLPDNISSLSTPCLRWPREWDEAREWTRRVVGPACSFGPSALRPFAPSALRPLGPFGPIRDARLAYPRDSTEVVHRVGGDNWSLPGSLRPGPDRGEQLLTQAPGHSDPAQTGVGGEGLQHTPC
jgi:hypothetical protein